MTAEYPKVPDHVEPGWWYRGAEPHQKLEGLEHERARGDPVCGVIDPTTGPSSAVGVTAGMSTAVPSRSWQLAGLKSASWTCSKRG